MNSENGCKFCRRYGLPLLPVRPSVMEESDCLPPLPGNISVPVNPESGAVYTTRLLRQGFLYIWAEQFRRWINYYVTDGNYFYPLPEDGSVLPRIASGEITPCITRPQELATASLITLPVRHGGMPNGIFWFAWSEEQWTPAVRQQHEDAAWRSLHMQPFDMDAWLITHGGQQAVPLSQLTGTVAEYSPALRNSTLKKWAPSPLKAPGSHSAADLHQAAETLSAGNGAILVLPDPAGIATEISALAHHKMAEAINSDPKLQRDTALYVMVNNLEESMRNYFYMSAKESDSHSEQRLRYGWYSPAGPQIPMPKLADEMRRVSDGSRAGRVDNTWQKNYEKYIDREQVDAFGKEFDAWLLAFNEQTLVPLTRMYLAWLKSPEMVSYFIQHFDATCARSGARYIDTVHKVLKGMEDKGGVIELINEQLNHADLTRENYIQRAAFFNNDNWIEQVNASLQVSGQDWWFDVSWDRLGDAAAAYSGQYAPAILSGLEKLSLLWSNAMMKSIDLMLKAVPVRFSVAMLAMQGKAFSVVTAAPGTKNFVRAMTIGMGELLEMSGRSGGRLYSAMQKMADKLVADLPETSSKRMVLPRIIDVGEVAKLREMPVKERLAKLNTALLREDELARKLFPRSLGSTLAHIQGQSGNKLAEKITVNAVKWGGTSFSAYFQWVVLFKGLNESGLPATSEEQARLVANASMAVATSAELLRMVLAPLAMLEMSPIPSRIRDFVLRVVGHNVWKLLGFGGGLLYTGIEITEGASDIKRKKFDTGIAHLLNGAGVGIITINTSQALIVRFLLLVGVSSVAISGSALAAVFFSKAALFIGVLLVIGSGIWLVSQHRNNVQTWLLSIKWRRIPPGEKKIPAMFPNSQMELQAYSALFSSERHI